MSLIENTPHSARMPFSPGHLSYNHFTAQTTLSTSMTVRFSRLNLSRNTLLKLTLEPATNSCSGIAAFKLRARVQPRPLCIQQQRNMSSNAPFPPPALAKAAQDLASLLQSRKETISVAETAAGGLISAAILATPGASRVFRGGLTVSIDTLLGLLCRMS